MLEYRYIKEHKITLLKEFETDKGLWIVPHLQIKHDLQNFYIKSQRSLIPDPFRTITEFWKHIFRQVYPKLQITSDRAIKTFIKSHIADRSEKWCLMPGTPGLIFHLLTYFLPIFSHVEGPELLAQWLQTKPSLQKKWGPYLLEAMKIWGQINGRFVAPSWIPSLLLDSPHLQNLHLPQTIVVDMGCDLLSIEMQVLEKLSKQNHVIILCPEKSWCHKYPDVYSPYLNEKKSTDNNQYPNGFTSTFKNVTTKRFVSMLAEVKDATATVRRWIDEGTASDQIVICSPQIKSYWPVLKEYLDVEGVPCHQIQITPVSALPDIMKWLARIQVQLNPQAFFHTLEVGVFGGQQRSSQRQLMNYETFHRMFGHILDPLDYQRSKSLHQYLMKHAISREAQIEALAFITYVLQLWEGGLSSNASLALEKILQIFMEESKILPQLKALEWLELLEHIISNTRLPSLDFSLKGVGVTDLALADQIFAQKIYMMGLSEQDLHTQNAYFLTNADVMSIKNELGFHLNLPERSVLEVHADLLLSHPKATKVVSFPETNFMGESLTPSLLWLMASSQDSKGTEKPKETVWDLYQKQAENQSTAHALLQLNHLSSTRLKQVLQKEQHLPELTNYKLTDVSVSGLERYDKCPFIFYVEDVLRLKSLPVLEMDVQKLEEGALMHEMLSKLTQEPFQSVWTNNDLDSMIQEYLDNKTILAEPKFQKSFKEVLVKKLQEFLQFERKWRKEFPQTKVLLREKDICAYIDPKTGNVSSTQTQGSVLVKGRLDRLDQVGDHAFAIIDYKLSLNGKTNYKTWIKNGQFQLALYALMAKEGCIEGVSGDVASSAYFGLKEMKRDKGFFCKEYNNLAHPSPNTSHSTIKKEGLEGFFQDLKQRVSEILSAIEKGYFPADPKNQTSCSSCPWRYTCKAPHLK